MKKLLTILTAAVLGAAIGVACGGGPKPEVVEPAQPEAVEPAAPEAEEAASKAYGGAGYGGMGYAATTYGGATYGAK